MKTTSICLLATGLLFALPGYSQETSDKPSKKEMEQQAESQLNQMLAATKKVKTQVEETARFAIENIDNKSPLYEETFKSYVRVQSEFDQWIEFYVLEFNSSMKNKKHTLDRTRLDTLIHTSINSANSFMNNLYNQPNLASKGIPMDAIFSATNYVQQAYDLYKSFRDAKKEHRDMIMKELEDKFSKYKLKSFYDLK